MNDLPDIVILGLSVTSSWGNGHATTYRSLIRGLAARGHHILFLERGAPWYAGNRDEPHPVGCRTELYHSFEDLIARFEREVSQADLVIVGSFVPDGIRIGDWVISIAGGICAFYDIDTPVTMARLAEGRYDFVSPAVVFHSIFPLPADPSCGGSKASTDRRWRVRSTVLWTPICTGRGANRSGGIWGTWARKAKTGNPCSTGCCSNRRASGRKAGLRSSGRCIPKRSAGRRMYFAIFICRRGSSRRSTASSDSR